MTKVRGRDLKGMRFGRLLVIEKSENLGKETAWKCLCDCGTYKVIRTRSLGGLKGTKSCGCIKSEITDLTGKVYGYYRVESYYGKTSSNNSRWNCVCVCGNKRIVDDVNLKSRASISCGCKDNIRNKTHDLSRSSNKLKKKVYKAWSSMRQRCNNPNNESYVNYGARGIKVCSEWDNLEDGVLNFYKWSVNNGVTLDSSIDRINNNGNYEPNNCRWTSMIVQQNNKRTNNYFTVNGETHTLAIWARIYDLPIGTIRARLKSGWTIEKALTQPIDITRRSKDYVKNQSK